MLISHFQISVTSELTAPEFLIACIFKFPVPYYKGNIKWSWCAIILRVFAALRSSQLRDPDLSEVQSFESVFKLDALRREVAAVLEGVLMFCAFVLKHKKIKKILLDAEMDVILLVTFKFYTEIEYFYSKQRQLNFESPRGLRKDWKHAASSTKNNQSH